MKGKKKIIILAATLMFTIIVTENLCEAASTMITSNIDGNVVCPGEKLILTCTSVGNAQRWNVRKEDSASTEEVFIRGDQLGIRRTWNSFTFTLISTEYSNFESTLSTVVTNAVNNTVIACSGDSTSGSDTATLRIADESSPPQNLGIISIEHHANYSTVVVMWEPASNDSRVDFYQYQLIDSLTEVRASNTTNTTAILSDVPYNVNISFIISAYNCDRESEQATLIIKIIGPTYAIVRTAVLYTPTQTLTLISAHILETPSGTSSPKQKETFLLSTYIISATVVTVLCILAGLTTACICKAALANCKNKVKSKSTTDSSSGEYDDIVGPVYDTISPSDSSICDGKVSMTENEAYKSFRFKETKFTSLAGDVSNKEANYTPGSAPIVMEKNSSYQTTVPRRLVATNSEVDGQHTPSGVVKNTSIFKKMNTQH